jgi:hypothetical protein
MMILTFIIDKYQQFLFKNLIFFTNGEKLRQTLEISNTVDELKINLSYLMD